MSLKIRYAKVRKTEFGTFLKKRKNLHIDWKLNPLPFYKADVKTFPVFIYLFLTSLREEKFGELSVKKRVLSFTKHMPTESVGRGANYP